VSDAKITLRPDRAGVEVRSDYVSLRDLADRLRRLDPGVVPRQARGCVHWTFADAAALLAGAGAVTWAGDARRAVENREEVRARAGAVVTAAERIEQMSADELSAAMPDRPLLRALDEHQLRNVALMTVPYGWGACIFDEQGTGKTPTVIAAFDVLVDRDEADVLVVVAPKSMVGEWRAEFERFTGDLYRVAVIEGARLHRAVAMASGADVVVLNYEAAIAQAEDLRLLAARSRVVLAVDESYNVKNPDAARTGAVADLREWCTRCFALCGTPAPNRARDVVAQVDLVDFGMTFDGVTMQDDPDLDRALISDALHSRGLFSRNLKQRVLPDLPSRQFTEIRVPFAPRQRVMYEEALDSLILDLWDTDDTTFERQRMTFSERRNTLLRLCSHPSGIADGYDEVPAKVAALDDLLADRIGRGEKVVVWSYYRHSLDVLAERYLHYGLARIDGSIADISARRDAVRRFQDDDETMVFLGNPAAAGAGLTLHRAAVAVYESFSNQAAHFMQSLDRIHRRGQERDVEYVVLLCDGSVEEDEYERILTKVDSQADLLGDPVPSRPTRTMMIDELVVARQRLK
jgi:SNF2 family DNA or RNA helicase